MRPFVWWAASVWIVTRPKTSGVGWSLSVWPGTAALGYSTASEAGDAARAALASS